MVVPVATNLITASNPALTMHRVVPIETNTITLTAAEETEHLVVPVESAILTLTAPNTEPLHRSIPVTAARIDINAGDIALFVSGVIDGPAIITITAPTAVAYANANRNADSNIITITAAEERIAAIGIVVETNTIRLIIGGIDMTVIAPADAMIDAQIFVVEPNFDTLLVPMGDSTEFVVGPNADTFTVLPYTETNFAVDPNDDTFYP